MSSETSSLKKKALECLLRHDIDPAIVEARRLPLFEEPDELVIADTSGSGREHLLCPEAASAWRKLKAAARKDDISLIIISAFRSFERQEELLQKSLESGRSSASILRVSAPPGYSEHHSGNALDIGSAGCEPLSNEFGESAAYRWLKLNAGKYGFSLSYPERNSFGFDFEPWHWRYQVIED